jgi:CRISPR-associated endonuclease/helicase Cas3
MTGVDFPATFEGLTGHAPFPWQAALYQRFVNAEMPTSCNIPTGLGKTHVIAVWLLALATKPASPPGTHRGVTCVATD